MLVAWVVLAAVGGCKDNQDDGGGGGGGDGSGASGSGGGGDDASSAGAGGDGGGGQAEGGGGSSGQGARGGGPALTTVTCTPDAAPFDGTLASVDFDQVAHTCAALSGVQTHDYVVITDQGDGTFRVESSYFNVVLASQGVVTNGGQYYSVAGVAPDVELTLTLEDLETHAHVIVRLTIVSGSPPSLANVSVTF